MPLPTPKPRESRQKFVQRCMAHPTMVKEFPKIDQRYAVCHRQADKRSKR